MSEGLLIAAIGVVGAVVGGVIAGLVSYITMRHASDIETERWFREKLIAHLEQRINRLNLLLEQGVKIVNEYNKGIRTGLLPEAGGEIILMHTAMSSASSVLWADVIKAVNKNQENRIELFNNWLINISGEILDARKDIEDLLEPSAAKAQGNSYVFFAALLFVILVLLVFLLRNYLWAWVT